MVFYHKAELAEWIGDDYIRIGGQQEMMTDEKYDTLESKLDRWGLLMDKIDLASAEKERQIRGLLTDEQLRQMEIIEQAYHEEVEVMELQAQELKRAITADVILRGETVKGKTRMAVFTPGHYRWVAKSLNVLVPEIAKVFPGIYKCRVKGKPSVRIQRIKS